MPRITSKELSRPILSLLTAIRTVVASLCIGLAETINKLGTAFIENSMYARKICRCFTKTILDVEQICNIAIQVLSQKALCQQDPDQDENEEAPEDQAEYDSVLISSAGDLVAGLSNALGTDFAQAFGTFFPLIARYYVSNTATPPLIDP